jgi:hypothetical protein
MRLARGIPIVCAAGVALAATACDKGNTDSRAQDISATCAAALCSSASLYAGEACIRQPSGDGFVLVADPVDPSLFLDSTGAPATPDGFCVPDKDGRLVMTCEPCPGP